MKSGLLCFTFAASSLQPKYQSPSLKRDFTNVVLSTRVVVEK